jgi:hypothetical protein
MRIHCEHREGTQCVEINEGLDAPKRAAASEKKHARIGARLLRAHQLDELQLTRVGQVRAAAHVEIDACVKKKRHQGRKPIYLVD